MSGGGDAVTMLRAILAGQDYPPAGVPDTPGNKALWKEIAADLDAMPAGVLPEIPPDWTEYPDATPGQPGGTPGGGGTPEPPPFPDSPAAAGWDPLRHPRDAHGRFARKATMIPGGDRWETSSHAVKASDLRPGDFIGAYKITKVEHGSARGTTRVHIKGGGRITLRDDYHVFAAQTSYGGESFFSENKTLHYGDPGIKDLTRSFGRRLHVAEDGAGWDTSAVQRHLRGLQEVPAAHRRFLTRSRVEVYIGTEPVSKQDDQQHLSAVHPPGYPAGDTYDDCAAAFSWPEYDTTIRPEFGKTYDPPMTKPGKVILGNRAGAASVNAAAHETGHALDKFLGEDMFFRGAGELSMGGEFAKAYERFSARKLPGYTSRLWAADPYYLQEADDPKQAGVSRRGEREAFAEGYAAWVHTARRPSKYRAEEIMDALGFVLTPGARADPKARRAALAAKRQIGQALIEFYDSLGDRITWAAKRLPPPHMKAGTP